MSQGPDGIASDAFRIRGIIKTGVRDIDASTVIVHRRMIGRMLDKENDAHEIAIMLPSQKQIDGVFPEVSGLASGVKNAKAYRWEDAMPDLSSGIQFDYVSGMIIVAFLYLLVGIGTLNTLLMSVMERSREFGVIRALGLGRSGVFKIVTSEALVLGFIGITFGFLLSLAAGLYTSTKGLDFSAFFTEQGFAGSIIEPIIYSIWDWRAMFVLCLAMLLLALAASLYPVHRILKIKPSEAMRKY
jgi:ABC-type lipoprotein release transport system permease subunit